MTYEEQLWLSEVLNKMNSPSTNQSKIYGETHTEPVADALQYNYGNSGIIDDYMNGNAEIRPVYGADDDPGQLSGYQFAYPEESFVNEPIETNAMPIEPDVDGAILEAIQPMIRNEEAKRLGNLPSLNREFSLLEMLTSNANRTNVFE